MHTVEIEATGVHQTPNSLVGRCAAAAGLQTVCFTKVHTGWKVKFKLASMTSWVIFNIYGIWHCEASSKWDILVSKSCSFLFQLWLNLQNFNVKYTKSCLVCLYSSTESLGIYWYVFLVYGNCLKMNFSPWLYKWTTQCHTHFWLRRISACIHQNRAGINKCYLEKVKQVLGLELQPNWGAQELKGKQRGVGGWVLFLEEFLKHSKPPRNIFHSLSKVKLHAWPTTSTHLQSCR